MYVKVTETQESIETLNVREASCYCLVCVVGSNFGQCARQLLFTVCVIEDLALSCQTEKGLWVTGVGLGKVTLAVSLCTMCTCMCTCSNITHPMVPARDIHRIDILMRDKMHQFCSPIVSIFIWEKYFVYFSRTMQQTPELYLCKWKITTILALGHKCYVHFQFLWFKLCIWTMQMQNNHNLIPDTKGACGRRDTNTAHIPATSAPASYRRHLLCARIHPT